MVKVIVTTKTTDMCSCNADTNSSISTKTKPARYSWFGTAGKTQNNYKAATGLSLKPLNLKTNKTN